MVRVIGHLDLDYFYAQVEEVEDPSLKSRPVIVCVFSGRTEDSGVVGTANYIARGLGVHSGMPIVQAKRKLQDKDPAIIRMDHEKYEVVSARIMETVSDGVDILEPTGIDEAFFDVTSSSGGDFERARLLAQKVKDSVLQNERLTCSIGLGRSKVVAKLGSDMAKPNGLKVVLPSDTESFLGPLPVTRLYGVGPKTTAALEQIKVGTVADLSRANPSELERLLGRKLAAYLLAASTGTDDDPVRGDLEPTQFSRIVTLKRDTKDASEVIPQLSEGVEHLVSKLRASGKSFKTLTAIAILTDLSTKTKSRTFESPASDADTIRDGCTVLFQSLSESVTREFRRAGIRVSGLSSTADQSSLSEFLQPAK